MQVGEAGGLRGAAVAQADHDADVGGELGPGDAAVTRGLVDEAEDVAVGALSTSVPRLSRPVTRPWAMTRAASRSGLGSDCRPRTSSSHATIGTAKTSATMAAAAAIG